MSATQGLWALQHPCLCDKCCFSLLPDESLNEIHLRWKSATTESTHDADTKSTTREAQRVKKREVFFFFSIACLVLNRVEHFSRPATFQSAKIDLFVMKGAPFRILRACNLCEMGVSLTKTGRQRLKNDTEGKKKVEAAETGAKKKRGLLF